MQPVPRLRFFIAAAWAAALLFLLLSLSLPEPQHRLEYVRIENARGMPLWAVVYSPEPASAARAPAVVVCQPLNSPPEAGRLLALELVQDGFVALVFNWRGRGPGENRQVIGEGVMDVLRADAAAAIKRLRSMPGVDPKKVFVTGHSVGGTLAIETGVADTGVAGVAAVGIEAEVSPTEPRNLLWAVGLYDEFRHLNRMREAFRVSADAVAPEDTTVGDFASGTARRLGVSPTADHFTEFLDHNIHREVVDWFRQAAGLPLAPRRYWVEVRHLLVLLSWLASLFAALLTMRLVGANRQWLQRAIPAAALAGILLLVHFQGVHFLAASSLIFWLLLFALLAGCITKASDEGLSRAGRFLFRGAVILWASLLLTLVVNNIASYAHEPRWLLSLPEFALRHPLDALLAYFFIYPRPFLFSVYDPQQISPRLWLYVVLVLELAFPGFLLALGARVARRRAAPAKTKRRLPLASLLVLAALLLFLVGVTWMRLAQGFLTAESALAAGRFLVRYTVLPIFLFALLWRWWRKKPPAGR